MEKLLSFLWASFLLTTVAADLGSDKQALLDFASDVPQVRKLNWKRNTRVCTSWVGITCSDDGSRVVALRVPGIGLYGPLPVNTTLATLDALQVLSLHSNFLTGNLPSELLSLPSLQYIYLQDNNFSGLIPSTVSPNLKVLNLSFNSLTGNIPYALGKLTRLVSLSLQNNLLSGSIPELNVSGLKQLNLSHNRLNGSIPSTLQRFPVSSFQGNVMLCGLPLENCSIFNPSPSSAPSPQPVSPSPSPFHLPPSPMPNLLPPTSMIRQNSNGAKGKLSKGSLIAIAVGGPVIVMPILITVMICYLRKNGSRDKSATNVESKKGGTTNSFSSGVQNAEKNKLVFVGGCSYNFDLEDLLRASAEVLGKGSYGTTYKAVLEDGTTFVVKRLREVIATKREFEQQMEIVGKIREIPYVLTLRAYYYSKDEKLLVYDYVSDGSLSLSLHGYMEIGRIPLDWRSRVEISLDAARGIAYIHSVAGGRFFHGNIKSSNILLNHNSHACISDFGIIPLTNNLKTTSQSIGYSAPEVTATRKPTQKSDVYSFGVIMLELLTGKSSAQSAGNDDGFDLPRWVQSVIREEWTVEVFDAELMRRHNMEDEMMQMLQIAMTCVSRVPDVRPTMEQVVQMIENIQASDAEERHYYLANHSTK